MTNQQDNILLTTGYKEIANAEGNTMYASFIGSGEKEFVRSTGWYESTTLHGKNEDGSVTTEPNLYFATVRGISGLSTIKDFNPGTRTSSVDVVAIPKTFGYNVMGSVSQDMIQKFGLTPHSFTQIDGTELSSNVVISRHSDNEPFVIPSNANMIAFESTGGYFYALIDKINASGGIQVVSNDGTINVAKNFAIPFLLKEGYGCDYRLIAVIHNGKKLVFSGNIALLDVADCITRTEGFVAENGEVSHLGSATSYNIDASDFMFV